MEKIGKRDEITLFLGLYTYKESSFFIKLDLGTYSKTKIELIMFFEQT